MKRPTIIDFKFEDADDNEQTYYVVNPEWVPAERQTHDEPGSPGYSVWDRVVLAADGSGIDLTDKIVAGTWSQRLWLATCDAVERACTE